MTTGLKMLYFIMKKEKLNEKDIKLLKKLLEINKEVESETD